MARLIDLHAHVLPGVDDGPPDEAAAIAVCARMAEGGVRTVVATSHVSETYPNGPRELAAARERLIAALGREGIALEVLPGAEVTIEQALTRDDESLARLGLGGGPYVLIEAPLSPAAVDVERPVMQLVERGHRVVLAHPERAPCFQRDHEQLVRLVAAGVLTSITAGAVLGRFGRTAERAARRLLDEELVHDVASDAHDLVGRPPGLDLPVGGAAARWFVTDAPAAILRGQAPGMAPERLELPDPEPRRRGLLGRLRRR